MSKFFEIMNKPRSAPGASQATAAPPADTAVEAAQPVQQASLMPPFMPSALPRAATAPGVLPPPAAPVYSMRAPEAAPAVEPDVNAAVAETVSKARGAQASVQERARLAAQRARAAAAPAMAAPMRPAQQPVAPAPPVTRAPTRQSFDPTRAAQAGLLNLAWSWQQAGSPIRAIHAYMELLMRYPDTQAAAAAVSDLVSLSDRLAGEGQFHTALGIYDQLEQLL